MTLANCKQRIVVIGSGTSQQSLVLSFRLQFSSLGRRTSRARLGPGLLRWVTNDGALRLAVPRPPARGRIRTDGRRGRSKVVDGTRSERRRRRLRKEEERREAAGRGPPSFSVPFQNKNVTVRVPAQCAAQLAFTDCRTTVRARGEG